MARTLELCSLPNIKSACVGTASHVGCSCPLSGDLKCHWASDISMGLKPIGTVPGCQEDTWTQQAAERELAALGAACSRAETWQQRAPSAALLRQKDREILVLVVELETGVVAVVQASCGKGSAVWAWDLVVEFHNSKGKIRCEK